MTKQKERDNCLRGARRSGVTLAELMVALAVLTIGVLSSMGSFKYINKAITLSRTKTIAANLAQEKMGVLKNKSYHQLLVTTHTNTSSGYPANFEYDMGYYPPQTITLWGYPEMTRVVNVDYVTLSGSVATRVSPSASDPGMKRISVYVMWTDSNGDKRKVQLDSYYENPNVATRNSGFRGTVRSGGSPVGNALVQVMEAPRWSAYTDASGNYSFQVVPGTYSLVCSTQMYYSTASPTVSVLAGETKPVDFNLVRIPTGTITGTAYLRDHMVIYMVVPSSRMVNDDEVEFVSLYNPTTYQITMWTGSDNNIRLGYYGESGAAQDHYEFWLNYRSTFVPSGYHFLIASTGTFQYHGYNVTADAVYSAANSPECTTVGNGQLNCIRRDRAGAVTLKNLAYQFIDKLGWCRTSAGKNAPIYEGAQQCWDPDGPVEDGQFFRFTSPWSGSALTGSAYDTNNNNANFFYFDWGLFPAMNLATGYKAPVTGTPAAGAIVVAGDGLSSPVRADSNGEFTITNVATSAVQNVSNTVSVTIATGTLMTSVSGLTIPGNANRDLGNVHVASANPGGLVTGYVYGDGPDYNKPLGNPTIKVASPGVNPVNTDAQGFYLIFVPTGTVVLYANYGNANGSYEVEEVTLTVPEGGIVQAPTVHLAQAGRITGYVTSGTGALPNIVVQASNGLVSYEDTTDSAGGFYIYAATSFVAYTVAPVLDPMQSYTSAPATPLTCSMASPGSTVFAGTITVVGAMGTIEGTVRDSSAAITTGVLVVASTATVTDPPATITASVAPARAIYYSVSSQADGTYSLEVRSSTTTPYNMRVYYPVVDTTSGAVTYTSKTSSGIYVNAGGTVTRNFAW